MTTRIQTFDFRRDSILLGETPEERDQIIERIQENDRLEALLAEEDELIRRWNDERELADIEGN